MERFWFYYSEKDFAQKRYWKHLPVTGLFWSHWSHIAPPGNHWSLLQYTGIAWQLMVTNSARWSHLAPHRAKFRVFSCHAWRLLCRLGDKKNKSNKNSAQERWELQTGRRMKNQKQTLGFINLTLTIWHSKLHKLAWQIIAHFLTKIRSIKLLNWLIFCSSLSPVSTGRIHPSSTTQTKNIYLRTSITCKWNISPIRQSLLGACWGIFDELDSVCARFRAFACSFPINDNNSKLCWQQTFSGP